MSEEVQLWMHCKQCFKEKPPGISPKDFSRTQAGVTDSGEIIVWCNRHDTGVAKFQLAEEETEKLFGCSCGCTNEKDN